MAGSRVTQNTASQIMKAEHVIEFPEQQQTAVRPDLRFG